MKLDKYARQAIVSTIMDAVPHKEDDVIQAEVQAVHAGRRDSNQEPASDRQSGGRSGPPGVGTVSTELDAQRYRRLREKFCREAGITEEQFDEQIDEQLEEVIQPTIQPNHD